MENLFDHGPFVIYKFETDENLTLHLLTKNAEKRIGLNAEEIISHKKGYIGFIHPEDRETYIQTIKNINPETENFQHKPYRLITNKGTTIWVSDYAAVELDKKGSVAFITGYISDITEQKILEQKLSEQQKKLDYQNSLYETLLKTLPLGVFMVDAQNGQPLVANEKARELLGRGILPDANRSNLQEVYQAYKMPERISYPVDKMPVVLGMQGISAYVDDMLVERPDGTETLLEVYGSPVINSEGTVWASLVTFNDISLRKRSEEEKQHLQKELKKTQALLQSAFEQSPVPMALATVPDNKFKIINKAAEDFLLIDAEKYLDKSPTEIDINWQEHYPDGTRVEIQDLPMPKALNGIAVQNMEMSVIRNDGSTVWQMAHGAPIFSDEGNLIAGLLVMIDVTQNKLAEERLKTSEEKFNALFGAMTEMVVLHEVVFNEKGEAVNYRIIDCNKAYTDITGIEKSMAVGKLATEVYQSDDPPYMKEFVQVGITGVPFEYTTYYAPMDKHFMISVVSPQKNRFATITTDISGIKQIEEVLSVKNKELENYLYIASHDLRSPLVNIQGFSKRLQKQQDEIKTLFEACAPDDSIGVKINKLTLEDIPRTLDFIHTNTLKMDKLINGLLQISRTGRVRMSINRIDINKMLEKIVQGFSFQMDEIAGKIELDQLPDCFGDPDLLNQLFSNIFDNSIKYRHPRKQLLIKIKASATPKKVTYHISDNGIGISSANLEKIWDVFYRVNPGHEIEGEGIGLSIAKRIVDKHKGKISVESIEEQGTTFHVELNRQKFTEL